MVKCLIFLHVPKAAGTTLHSIIAANYPAEQMLDIWGVPPSTVDEFAKLPEAERARLRVVKGHFKYGIHEFIPRPCSYITVLREPIDRAVSHYHYALGKTSHPHYSKLHSQKLSLADYAKSEISMENCHVRMISGVGATIPYGQCTQETLETAKKNLEKSFDVVGLAERFDESVLLMQRALGWKTPYYAKQNVTAKRPALPNIKPEDLEALRQTNALDIELYQYGVALFEKALSSQPASFQEDLAAFKRANVMCTEETRLQHILADYRKRKLPWVFWPGAWKARQQRNALRKAMAQAYRAAGY